ncbi:hypothetical protein FS842_007218 [Serendipita sp. 407]|nr:hypothetical protein FS842_007218 [Serendipita sp. 407]
MENPTSGEETPSGSSMIARIALSDLMRVGDTAAAPLSPKLIGLDEPFESYEEVSEIEEQFLSIVSNISEATELLSPLEAACALLIKGIQTARNVHNHQVAWADLLEDLSSQVSQMGEYRDELQGKPSVADKRSLKALEQYLRVTTEILDQATKPYFNMQSGIWENIKRASIVQKEKEEIARYRQRVSNAWQFYSVFSHNLLFGYVSDRNRPL